MEKKEFDVAVLGGGPGGYVAAIRAAERGAKVALIEATQLGGTCLNRGCIPTKALLTSSAYWRKLKEAQEHGVSLSLPTFNFVHMKERKDRVVEKLRRGLEGLMASHAIEVIAGFGKLISVHEIAIDGTDTIIAAKKIILATGSEPRELPFAPFDGSHIHSSTTLLEQTSLPKSLLIIGGGIIGCEFASLYADLGVEVTIIELLPILISTEGKEMAEQLLAAFRRRGIKVELNATVKKLERRDDKVVCELADSRIFETERALVAVGRKLNTMNIGLEKAGLSCEKNGTITVNEKMQTPVASIYAIGDITGKWMLAHVASHQGMIAADNAMGFEGSMDYNAVPSVTYTNPEIATVGFTLEKAGLQGIDAKAARFPFQALGKSHLALETEGFAQIVIEKSTNKIIGAQVIGAHAATMIAEVVLAIANHLKVESITETIHAHPTTPEAWLEAASLALDMPIHFPPKKTAQR